MWFKLKGLLWHFQAKLGQLLTEEEMRGIDGGAYGPSSTTDQSNHSAPILPATGHHHPLARGGRGGPGEEAYVLQPQQQQQQHQQRSHNTRLALDTSNRGTTPLTPWTGEGSFDPVQFSKFLGLEYCKEGPELTLDVPHPTQTMGKAQNRVGEGQHRDKAAGYNFVMATMKGDRIRGQPHGHPHGHPSMRNARPIPERAAKGMPGKTSNVGHDPQDRHKRSQEGRRVSKKTGEEIATHQAMERLGAHQDHQDHRDQQDQHRQHYHRTASEPCLSRGVGQQVYPVNVLENKYIWRNQVPPSGH